MKRPCGCQEIELPIKIEDKEIKLKKWVKIIPCAKHERKDYQQPWAAFSDLARRRKVEPKRRRKTHRD